MPYSPNPWDPRSLSQPMIDSSVRAIETDKMKVLIAARVLGASNQPWLWRQITGLDDFQTRLLCWERRIPTESDPLSKHIVHVMKQEAAPYDGNGRWWYRFRNMVGGNFYGAVGPDRAGLATLLRRERPAAVLCYFGDVAMRILPAAKQECIPVIAYLHGDFLFNSNRWYRWSLKRCLPQFASIATVTEAERQWLIQQRVPAKKIHVIPCGAPTEVFRPTVREEKHLVQFVMCSRLVAEKGCDIAIRAYARVVKTTGNVQLQIFGDGPARGQLEELVNALKIKDSVFFHGYITEKRLAGLLPSCDVFIQHSLAKEGSPVSIAEAMACGLPVVTTPVGGMADQVVDGKTGFLVHEHDEEAMAARMQRLARDSKLRLKLGQAGHHRAIEAYDCSHQTRRLSHVIRQVMLSQVSA